MQNTTIRKTINVDKPNRIPIVNFKQEDDAVLLLSLYRNSIELDLTGQTIKLGVKRANNSIVELTDGFLVDKNNIDITLKNNILAIPGIAECDLELIDSKGKMTTASFLIAVNKKVLGTNNIEASNDISAINKIVAEVLAKGKELDSNIKVVVEEANKKITAIDTALNKKLNEMQADYNSLQRIIIDENQAANLQDQINKSNEQLDTKVQQFIDGYANVEYFNDLVVDMGTENEDYIPAINKCLELYGNCYIPKDIQIGSKIILDNYNKIKFAHKETTVTAKIGFSDDCMLGLKTTNTIGYEITNGRFFGQMLNQTNTFKGLDLTNENQDGDTYARINNIIIEQVPSDGFTYKGSGESFISDIMIRWSRGKGFVLDCCDTFFSKLSSGITAEEAFYISSANCTFNQCKGWFSPIGYNVTGKRNTFIGCESQDNTTLLDLKGESNQFFGIYLESAGVRNESVSVDNSTSVIIRSTAMNNTIYGKADDRNSFQTEHRDMYWI